MPPTSRTPEGLSRRARYFVENHGLRVPCRDLRRYRDVWLEHGIPAAEIDRAVAFQEVRGGIALPPAPAYEGGPRVLEADVPEGPTVEGWRFPAGERRVSSAYGFMIGSGGEFGIDADTSSDAANAPSDAEVLSWGFPRAAARRPTRGSAPRIRR
ncbi:hypothetical protein [Nocardia sp. X0981]